MIESPASHEHPPHTHPSNLRTGWFTAVFAGLVGVVFIATAQAASATTTQPTEPAPSESPRLSAAVQARLMTDILPASPPVTLTAPVTDGTGILSDAEREDVTASLNLLTESSDLHMFVVYIETFDGIDPVDWANASANQSGLGTNDLLLAIATTDHTFGISAASGVALTNSQLNAVHHAVAPAVEDKQWASAATDAAAAVRHTTTDTTSPLWVIVGTIAGTLVLIVTGYFLWRFAAPRLLPRLARRADNHLAPGGATPDELDDLILAQLDERAAVALVGIDDALKTCEQELGFARTELGADATRGFEQILARAAADVRQAFAIQQMLDVNAAQTEPDQPDEIVDGQTSEEDRRHHLVQVIALCEGAADTLDKHTRAFDELRRLQQRTPEILADVASHAPEVARRVANVRSTLEHLTERYPAETLATVSGNPEQAELLLTNTQEAVSAGHAALAAGQKAVAVAHARGAQNALGQAVMLLDAVNATTAHLNEAADRINRARASLGQDIASCATHQGDPRIALARTAAQTALHDVDMMQGGGDPLAGLQRIASAESALDNALAPTRDATERAVRASALLRDTLSRVTAQLRQTSGFIATRRGAIGATARTRLAEAVRLADIARALHPADPAAALEEAQRASLLVREATQRARHDADIVLTPTSEIPRLDTGTSGADRTGIDPITDRVDANGPITGGMTLGGILLDPKLVRSRKRDRMARIGGGFGGGGFGGGRPSALRRLSTVHPTR